MEGLEPGQGVSWGSSSAQWPAPAYWGWGQVSSCWSKSPEGRVHVCFFPSKCVLSTLPALVPSPQRGAVLEQEGLSRCLVWVVAWARVVLAPEFQTTPQLLPPQVPAMSALTWLSCCLGLSQLCPLPLHTLLACDSPCPKVELHHGTSGAGAGARLSLGHALSVAGNRPVSQAVPFCFLCLVSGVNKCVHTVHKQSLGFLQPCYSPTGFLTS